MGNEVTVLDNETLQTLLAEWQERLGLQDWDIRAQLVGNRALPDAKGDTNIRVVSREAIVRVLDPAHWEDYSGFVHDPEKTLVHELLHCLWLQWDDFPEDLAQDRMCHQTLDRLAKVLVKLKRGGNEICI
jgi:hypothetical protein